MSDTELDIPLEIAETTVGELNSDYFELTKDEELRPFNLLSDGDSFVVLFMEEVIYEAGESIPVDRSEAYSSFDGAFMPGLLSKLAKRFLRIQALKLIEKLAKGVACDVVSDGPASP